MQTSQIISLAFALAGAMAAPPAPMSTGTAAAPSGAKGPKVPGTFNLYYCEDPSNYAFAVNDVSVTPRIPMPGSNVTVEIKGKLNKDITQGTQQKNTFGKIVDGEEKILFSSTGDICAGLDMAPERFDVKTCPIAKGDFDQKHSFQIPEPPKDFDISKISPEKLMEAKKHIDAIHAQMKEDLPSGDFFFRGQMVDAQENVMSCVYADLNKKNIPDSIPANGTFPALGN